MVDKDLFLYDLAVVAILKNEGHYLKEWLDYHLLAGVDHFYIYDNESPDNQAEVAAPYVEAGLVDYIPMPGKVMQYVAYNDAIKRFKFQSRYMAFIDGDEFIYPKSERSIVEVVDEILSKDPNAAGLSIHWQIFGSNGQEKADYSRGVLERFTRCAREDWGTPSAKGQMPSGNTLVKTISNPRRITYIGDVHIAHYIYGYYSINENGDIVNCAITLPVVAEKIAVNHYYTKSFEEFTKKVTRGRADLFEKRPMDHFKVRDRNEEFDDGILRYRAARAENFSIEDERHRIDRVTEALIKTLTAYNGGKIFNVETALTCRALSTYLRENFPADTDYWKICEEASLTAILNSLRYTTFADMQLLLSDLPNLLRLPYPAVKELRGVMLLIIPKMMNILKDLAVKSKRLELYKGYVELDYIRDLLKLV